MAAPAYRCGVGCAAGHLSVLHVLPMPAVTGTVVMLLAGAVSTPTGLGDAFDLTVAERGVFALIGDGATVTEAARRLGIRRSTVRTHLLHLFAKTGTRRQAELVRLAAHLASPRFGE